MIKLPKIVRFVAPLVAGGALLMSASNAFAYTWANYYAADAAYWAKNDECNTIWYWRTQADADPVAWGGVQQYDDMYAQCQVELNDAYEYRMAVYLSIITNGES
jgi:hypothetical protein